MVEHTSPQVVPVTPSYEPAPSHPDLQSFPPLRSPLPPALGRLHNMASWVHIEDEQDKDPMTVVTQISCVTAQFSWTWAQSQSQLGADLLFLLINFQWVHLPSQQQAWKGPLVCQCTTSCHRKFSSLLVCRSDSSVLHGLPAFPVLVIPFISVQPLVPAGIDSGLALIRSDRMSELWPRETSFPADCAYLASSAL